MALPEEYRLATELLEKESDRYWNRNNIMLLIQGALLALFGGVFGKGAIIEVAVSTMGLIFSILWYGIVYKGSLYVGRWDRVVMDIETRLKERLGAQFFAVRHMNDAGKVYERRGGLSIWGRTTTMMKFAIVTILVFWLFLLCSAPWRGRDVHFEGPIVIRIFDVVSAR
jgi:hypothetical protein